MIERIHNYLFKPVSNAPLIVFRVVFGCLLLYSTMRMMQKGWVSELYVDPVFHFQFFSWLKPLNEAGMYAVFYALIISAFCITVGFLFRLSTLLFLTLFTYVELLDKAFYLNHYYLVSLIVFLLAMTPANRRFSVDAYLSPSIRSRVCSNWSILVFKLQLSIVYFFAGLAKVNSDWLLRAQPLATWLPGRYEIPILGEFMHLKVTAFLFSWAGCLYDLTIWLFLWMKRWRNLAYIFVILFHVLTGILFPRIGMFPWIMMTSTLIFLSPAFHEKILSFFSASYESITIQSISMQQSRWSQVLAAGLVVFFVMQLILPLRHLRQEGNLFWNEKDYRFGWRVMLMEKNGFTNIIVRDPQSAQQYEVDQTAYLSPFQRQQMRSQPDMILQFAQFIGDQFYTEKGYAPEVFVKSRISLNGRRSQEFTDATVNVYEREDALNHNWIRPLK